MSTAAPATTAPKISLESAVKMLERRLKPVASELEGLRERRDEMRQGQSESSTERLKQQARSQQLRDDPAAIAETDELLCIQQPRREREAIRLEARYAEMIREFEEAHPDLDARLAKLESDQRTLELGKYLIALQPLAKAYLQTGDAHAKAATEFHAALLPLLEKFPATNLQLGDIGLPSRQQLLELEWPEGFFVRPPRLGDGRDLVSIYDCFRHQIASIYPELFAEDDPALGPPPANVPKISDQGVVW